jgi:integrase
MSIIKRGETQWYEFVFNGRRIRESTHQANREVARNMQAEHRTRLVREGRERLERGEKLGCALDDLRNCGECALLFDGRNRITSPDGERIFCCEVCEKKWKSRQSPTPMFTAFAERFREEMKSRHAKKPKTVTYYTNSLDRLLEFAPFQQARLDHVDEEMIAAYIAKRRKAKKRGGKTILVATVNRELEVLRRLVRIAAEWKVIQRVPKISREKGEVGRERILNHAEEAAYLAVAKQPLRDIATAIADGGFRPEEIFRARWEQTHFDPAGKAQYGWIHNPYGKTKYAKRNVSMTGRVRALLEMRHEEQGRPSEGWVFPAETASGHVDSLKSQHAQALEDSGLALPKGSLLEPLVLYSFRHTMLTRLGESGVDAFAIQKIAGHSSILTSQKYVHPTPERIEGAFTQLENYNRSKEEELRAEQERERGLVQ